MTDLFPDLQDKQIFVAEDDLVVAVDYYFELRRAGAKPQAYAPTNRAALDYLATHHVDAAVVDYELADGPCEPVLEWLRTHCIPYVVVTGCIFEMELHKSTALSHALSKPVTPAQVCRALSKALH